MYHSKGVGLAAPQINKPIRLFVIDTDEMVKEFDDEDRANYPDEQPIKKVFINARKIEETGDKWAFNEGCLSIPRVREDIQRNSTIQLSYLDEHFNEQTGIFHGMAARVIQHEYDHIDGKLFIDYLTPLKKRLIKKKLDDISAGKINVDYRMIFPK